MNITLSSPPALSGDTNKDLQALSLWCATLISQLKRVLYSLDSGNISYIAPSQLEEGSISLDKVALDGGCVKITGTGIDISLPDGSQYIRMSDGKISIKGEITEV
jgi:hypothetical protein